MIKLEEGIFDFMEMFGVIDFSCVGERERESEREREGGMVQLELSPDGDLLLRREGREGRELYFVHESTVQYIDRTKVVKIKIGKT